MKDKSLEITLIVVFGISGLAVMLMAWLWASMESQRIMATVAGLTGLLIATFKYISLRKLFRNESEKIPVRVELREKR
jgi:drug/metabolite transporter (DMT)-like permease